MPVDVEIYAKQWSEEYSLFGELYYDVTDKFSVIGGLVAVRPNSWHVRCQSLFVFRQLEFLSSNIIIMNLSTS